MGRSKHFADEGREDDGRRTAHLALEGGGWSGSATESCSRRRRACWRKSGGHAGGEGRRPSPATLRVAASPREDAGRGDRSLRLAPTSRLAPQRGQGRERSERGWWWRGRSRSPRRGERGGEGRRQDWPPLAAGTRGEGSPLHASPRRGEAATREGASAASGGGGGGVGPEVPKGGSAAVRGGAKIGPSSPQGRGARRMAAARPGEVPHLRGEAKGPLRGRGKPLTGHAARGGLSPRGRGARRKGRCAAGEVPHARRSPLRGEAKGPLRGRGKPLTGRAARGGLSPRGRGARGPGAWR